MLDCQKKRRFHHKYPSCLFLIVFLTFLALGGCNKAKEVTSPQLAPTNLSKTFSSQFSSAGSFNWTLQFVAPRRLKSVWEVSATDVFAVGGRPRPTLILHYDGNSWATQVNGGFAASEMIKRMGNIGH